MKYTSHDIGARLDRLLSRHRTPSPDRMQAAIDRVGRQIGPAIAPSRQVVMSVGPTRAWLVAAATVTLATAIGLATLRPERSTPLHRVLEGTVHEGNTLWTNGGNAQLALTDGSRVEMRSQSEIGLERAADGIRIRLTRGGIIVNAAKQGSGHLYVQTKDMTVSVVGTVFVVNADNDGSRVAVIEGEVRVQQGATETKLRPGEFIDGRALLQSRQQPDSVQPQAVASAGTAVFSVASELAWSRRAESLMAQLRKSASEQRPANVAAPQAPKEPRVAFEVVSIRSAAAPPAPGQGARGGGGGLNSRPAASGCVFDSFGYSFQLDPRRFAVTRTTLLHLAAYMVPVSTLQGPGERRPDINCGLLTKVGLLSGGPDWIRTDVWDVVATIPEGSFTSSPTLIDPVLQQMLRTMLAERFGLVMRRETRDVPVYLLKVGKEGQKFNGPSPRLRNTDPDRGPVMMVRGPDGKVMPATNAPPPADGAINILGGFLFGARNVTMATWANHLFGLDGRPVIDRTGLPGRYDFHYEDPAGRPRGVAVAPDGTALDRAVVKEMGFELEEARAPFDVWVIERAEKPTEN